MKLYVFDGGGFVKVGITSSIYRRLAALNSGSLPFDITLRMVMVGNDDAIKFVERIALSSLPGRIKGEWFRSEALCWQDATREVRKISTRLPAYERPQVFCGAKIADVFVGEISAAADGRFKARSEFAMAKNALAAMGYIQ